ncbi:phage regulatory protein, Rha family [Campylobacter blaseri]|uniref:Transposase IS30-like HTH domain-containing protein n=1 Tax=Campylobacter blaseri TaxID=2042961 RepID=A0A2P8R0Q2_9BACT|nr:Rha family transcriptional regulator [Campylobacter blaseri]PSM52085.1 hypothetical protein CQ405_05885 [Campylobacter blaseri]PSM53870.1 hypothetical protein CRN67_05885 [Campylobacter blaseri]QKF85574.1 phage regulatory protein, Rha family [Campylobacter blaseri]
MSSFVINNQQVSFEVVGNQTYTTSLAIASVFEKEHKHIIAKIKELPQDEFRELNFRLTERIAKFGAVVRSEPYYNLTRDGFSLLVMGFTGEKAYRWKIEFIKAFNMMESMLRKERPHLDNLINSLAEVNKKLEGYKNEANEFKTKYYKSLELTNSLLLEKVESKRLKTFEDLKVKGKGVKFSKDELNKAINLYKQGLNYAQIARKLNRSSWTIARHLRYSGLVKSYDLFGGEL